MQGLLTVHLPGHPDNENQSDGRTQTIDFNILKSSQSNIQYKTMKSQFVRCNAYMTTVFVNKLLSSRSYHFHV